MAGYSGTQRLLHRLALGGPAVLQTALSFDRMLGGTPPEPAGPPVFVCGLARSGTTIVMQLLHGSGAFTSLTYRNMPFVTAPVLWPRLAGRFMRDIARQERAHGDGIEVDADSPEAFEEVFWRAVLEDRQYADARRISPVRADDAAIAAFRGFVARVAAGRRYLSKNNPNLIRLGTLARAFPAARILVVLRDPGGFARSTLAQHRRFLEIHAADPFARRYMGWLGHYEFGADFRPLAFKGVEPPADPGRDLDAEWLAGYWLAAHRVVRERLAKGTVPGLALVSHADLMRDPAGSAVRIAAHVGLAGDALPAGEIRQSEPDIAPSGNAEADALFAELRGLALNAP